MEFAAEKVEKICRYTGVSSELARQALEEAGGSQLDAVILLEEKGWTRRPGGGVWSTRWESSADAEAAEKEERERRAQERPNRGRSYTAREVGDAIKSLFQNCTRITIEIWHKQELLAGIPLIIFILLFLIAPHIVFLLSVVGLVVMRCRYRISGWSFGEEAINRAMDRVSDTVDRWTLSLRKRIEQEIKHYKAEQYTRERRKEREADENKK